MDVLKIKVNDRWVSVPAIQGPQGETGPQGPQGPKGDKGDPGSGATEWSELENKPFDIIGTGLEVDSQGALNVTGGGGSVAIDNKTIVENQTTGEIETVIGGKWIEGKVPGDEIVNFNGITSTDVSSKLTYSIMQTLISKGSDLRANLNTGFGEEKGVTVTIDTSVANTYKLTCNYTITTVKCVYTGTGDSSSWSCIRSFQGGGSGYVSSGNSFYAMEDGLVPSPIVDGRFIPVDNTSISVNANNNLQTNLIAKGTGTDSINIGVNAATNASKASGYNSINIGKSQATGSNAIHISAQTGGSAPGTDSIAIGSAAYAEKMGSIAIGPSTCYSRAQYAVAIGSNCMAWSQNQIVLGRASKDDKNGVFLYILGNHKTAPWDGSDALAIDWSGNQYVAGDIYVNCSDYTTNSSGLVTANAGGQKLIPIPPAPDDTNTYVLKCIAGTFTWVQE